MAATPMMQQYLDAKAACGEALLLFRMGDFYELFGDDAKTAARVLGLTLTSREKGDDALPMAGFPHHQLPTYLARLIGAGLRAAVCDQVEDPKLAKGLVRREVTRIVTPGTVTDETLLDPRQSNYLAAVVPGTRWGLAWVELSTGRFLAATVDGARVGDELARIGPAECLVSDEGAAALNGQVDCPVTRRPAWEFSLAAARTALTRQFHTATLEGFGFDERDEPAIRAAGAVLEYLTDTQKTSLAHVEGLLPYRTGQTLEIDQASRRSLELAETMREGKREGSLLGVLDRAVTAMGSRLVAEWLASPLTDRAAIEARLDAVGELVEDAGLLGFVREKLRGVYDLSRLLGRVSTGRASPRDLGFVGRTLGALPELRARLGGGRLGRLAELEAEIDPCGEVQAALQAALVDDCPLASREGGLIRGGYSAELDRLRELAAGGKQWIARYQAEESQRLGIANLKVGYNKVFGYYLEVTHTHAERIPPHYHRKQTVKNAERYVTPELKEYEEQVLTADEQSRETEYRLFVELRELAAGELRRLQRTAAALAELDALAALAQLARQRGYCRPVMVDEPLLELREARHPVLDLVLPEGTLVPNDAELSAGGASCLLITGPNMAGKSTYIRQVALVTVLAQMGSWVPARAATIGIADRIFARVGASDELARGQSTFMVEMTESARILHGASRRSLVILDEIGRGTSTYDGLSLAWAMVEHLHSRVGCRTLFATHYHELTELAEELAGVRNLNVAVREWDEQVVFLHKIVAGAADKSYGIHVARLAGVPRSVVERAKEVLGRLEDAALARPEGAWSPAAAAQRERQLTLFGPVEHPLVEELRRLDLDRTAPREAWQWLERWQGELQGGHRRPR
jgi:DNA mismatch repair protein MutS